MKAIISKYIGPGNVRGARYVATDGDGRVSVGADDALNSEQNHRAAVHKLCAKRGWTGLLVSGTIVRRGNDSWRVWVWLEEKRLQADCCEVRVEGMRSLSVEQLCKVVTHGWAP